LFKGGPPFINYLAPSGNLTATISTVSPYMNIMNNTYVIGTLGMMGTADNSIAPFTAEILPGTPLNSAVVFQIDITDGTTTWIEYMTVTVNVDYINIDINYLDFYRLHLGNPAYPQCFPYLDLLFYLSDRP